MNYIKHLTAFFDRIIRDNELNPTHISLYIGLFQHWNVNRFISPVSISRDEVMRISKIASKATYHKCMKELHEKGYIKYEPSFNPFKGSMVHFFNFSDDLKPVQKRATSTKKISTNTEQALNYNQTGIDTSIEQALVPSINYINNTNSKNISNLNNQSKKIKEKNNSSNESVNSNHHLDLAEESQKEKKLREKKKSVSDSPTLNNHNIKTESKSFIEPTINEVKKYFHENDFPELEAQKFFNYFSSNGWLVGGKTPMVNWEASAKNWMLNTQNFKQSSTIINNRAKHLHTKTIKDYSEPL